MILSRGHLMKIGDRVTVVFEEGRELQGFLESLWDELHCANGEALVTLRADIYPRGMVPKPPPLCPSCGLDLAGSSDSCDCPGSTLEMADHPFKRRASWSGDNWCVVDGCTSAPSAHPH
jgi:hypothetical protein